MANLTSRTITGGAMLIVGTILFLVPLLVRTNASFVSWIYGLLIFIIGLFIFLNKKEDKIERIKMKGGKR